MDPVFRTNNDDKFNVKLEAGRCTGISVDWAKTSLEMGGVRTDSMLNAAKWDLYQSRYEIAVKGSKQGRLESVISDAGLTIINGAGQGEQFSASPSTVPDILARYHGTCVWTIFGPPGQGGHALGYRQTANAYEYLDPNDGLRVWDNQDDCKAFITQDLQDHYSHICSELYLYHVRL